MLSINDAFLTLKRRLLSTPMSDPFDDTVQISFTCNICKTFNKCSVEKIDREVQSCTSCGSTVRMRSIIHLLSLRLFGKSIPIPDFAVNKSTRGIGLSDWHGYAQRLRQKFDYTNTFFHQKPYLDIANPPSEDFGKYDFIISSDVFEHVPPPSIKAFEGAFNLLKPGGALILTVPFSTEEDTLEHFPDLNDYKVVRFQNDEYVLVNRDINGRYKVYENLVFHGGPGTTLEMRVFCRNDITQKFKDSGFQAFEYFDSDVSQYGILHKVNWSLPILAIK